MTRLALMGLAAIILVPADSFGARSLPQSARQIPVVREVNVVVVGGSLGAVAAAVEAAENGAGVLLVAPRTYLGEDICATLRLWLEEGDEPSGKLTEQIFSGERITTPMVVKKTLDAALLEARADFLLGCYPTDVLRDAGGKPAGIACSQNTEPIRNLAPNRAFVVPKPRNLSRTWLPRRGLRPGLRSGRRQSAWPTACDPGGNYAASR